MVSLAKPDVGGATWANCGATVAFLVPDGAVGSMPQTSMPYQTPLRSTLGINERRG